ncbi:MAG TPA: circadian clock KaiB family protein [Cytophagaceae bacterium]|jgi:circadian clock protein KaiB
MEPNELQNIEASFDDHENEKYILRLFITGITPNSRRAVENINKICEEYLKGRYDLEVIDIYQEPDHAIESQIIAAPTLIKISPAPTRKLIGDLSDLKKVLSALDIKARI